MQPRAFRAFWPAVLALVLAGGTSVAAQDQSSMALPEPDAELQAGLELILRQPAYRRLVQQGRLSVSLVDLTDGDALRYAGVDDDRERYAASLPKIGILLGVFDQIDKGKLAYTPLLRQKMEGMIRRSDNALSSELIKRVGFPAIAAALRDPKHQLYDEEGGGGIWVGRGYGGVVGLWRRDPVGNQSHGANTRQVARFLVMMDRGELVSPWASAQMKEIMGKPAIHHKFVRGLDARPNSVIYRKSGTWKQWHADAALVERGGRKYAAVALLDSPNKTGSMVLSNLIVSLDDLIYQPEVVTRTAVAR
jgi:beta-lactamase class A